MGEISWQKVLHYKPHFFDSFLIIIKKQKSDVEKISQALKSIIKTCFEHSWDQKWAPAQAAHTARTLRPIFDDKKCSKSI